MARPKKQGMRKGSLLHDSIFYDAKLDTITGSAFRLFVELNQQYNGYNNGNLCAARGSLRFIWNDKTLKKARVELVMAGIIELTRQGFKKKPNLYALTHLPINECEKHGIKNTKTPTNKATGKREYYFPVRRDPRTEVLERFKKK